MRGGRRGEGTVRGMGGEDRGEYSGVEWSTAGYGRVGLRDGREGLERAGKWEGRAKGWGGLS